VIQKRLRIALSTDIAVIYPRVLGISKRVCISIEKGSAFVYFNLMTKKRQRDKEVGDLADTSSFHVDNVTKELEGEVRYP
jgi:hypothetical protein